MRKNTARVLVVFLLVGLMVGMLGAGAFAVASEDYEAAARRETDPSFHREFGLFYDRASGFVYVSDSRANRIVRTKMDGSEWVTLGTLGSGEGQFKDPRGIYYDAESGYIYVTDTGNHRIVRTKIDGSDWATIGSRGSGEGQFYYPRGIWYDPGSDLIYVPDTANHRIVRTKIDGGGWETFGAEGRGSGQFLTPRGVQYDPDSELLYVADTGNSRIVRCEWGGGEWVTLGSHGKGEGRFREPRSLHYDAAGDLLYVADQSNNRIVRTRMDGSGWTTLGSFGGEEGQFFFPRGISLDPDTSTVFVADTFNDRIVSTEMDGSGWTSLGVKWRPYVWFFAEGTTRTEFDMFLTICNPGETDAAVHVVYMLSDGSRIKRDVEVIAHSRYTINVDKQVGDGKDLSVVVWSEEPVIVERPMYFRYGRAWPGGHVVVGRPSLDTDFFFAEGATREGFKTYLCLQNPGDEPANVDISYMFPDAGPQEQQVVVNPHSRKTIFVNEVVGPDKDVSIVVRSDVPILAERPMYFKYRGRVTGGHVVMGATEPDTHFYLAEGTTRAGFQTYLCLLNPGDRPAGVTLRYMFADGTNLEQNVTVEATSRQTVDVNEAVGGEKDVAIEIISDQPIVVERPMYFVYKGIIVGGHNIVATSDLGTTFYFAEGTTRPGFEEWICMLNPGDEAATVDITYMFSDGTTMPQRVTVGAHSRLTISVKEYVPEGVDVSLAIKSSQPIVVERPIYFNYNNGTTGGSVSMGYNQ